jgi:hypothetical protein
MALEDLILPRPFFLFALEQGEERLLSAPSIAKSCKKDCLAGISRKLRIKNKETEEMVDKKYKKECCAINGQT